MRRSSARVLYAIVYVILLTVISVAPIMSAPAVDETLPINYMPSGGVMFKQYCATCHGAEAKGNGPLASFLKVTPPDLTKLAQRHGGQFPYDYVMNVLEFGAGATAHGSSDMPAWGPIFEHFDKQNERAVQQRVKNLCDYLASLQQH